MTDTNLLPDDILDRAIKAIMGQSVPAQARSQAIEKAIAAETARQYAQPRAHWRLRPKIIELAIAASILIALGVVLRPALQKARSQKASEVAANSTQSPAAPPVQGNIPNANSPAQDDLPRAAYMSARVNILVADNAPVLLANGPGKPIQLGAQIPQSETAFAMQVWNWKSSTTSQIIATTEDWPGPHAAISPDGEFLVRADGRIKYLFKKEFSINPPESIDLGGAEYREGASTYTRIGQMRFAPDAKRLALFVTHHNADRTFRDVIQIAEFPSGKITAEFPAGESYALRIAFSPDSKQIASADPLRKISLRDCQGGKVLSEFDPPLKTQVMSIAISPDGKMLAASARDGELVVWDAQTANILWQTDNAKLKRPASSVGAEVLRFSPDNKFLAASCWSPFYILDASTGQIAGTIQRQHPAVIQWSNDSKIITIVSPVSLSEKLGQTRTVTYPTVQHFDWRTGQPAAAP